MKKKTYSAIVTTHDPVRPVQGGGALRTLLVARSLKARGWELCLAAPAGDCTELDGMRTLSFAAPRKQRSQILSSLKFNLRLLFGLLMRLAGTDLFFAHNTIACLFVPLLKPLFGFVFFLDITDVHAEYLELGRRNILERAVRPFLLWYEYRIIRCADRVVAATHAMRDLFIARGVRADRINVVYDGALSGAEAGAKEVGAEKTVIHLGAVDRQHGVDVFVRAAAVVLEREKDARFLVVGGGRELEGVRALAARLGVDGSFEFTDTVPQEKARCLLARAAIGVIARPYARANNIITTLKLFDYWASDTAVVAPELPGIAEIAAGGDGLMFFRPGDEREMAKKILELMCDNGLRNRLTRAGRARLTDFDFAAACGRIADLAAGTVTEG